jgi:hypothetical protein
MSSSDACRTVARRSLTQQAELAFAEAWADYVRALTDAELRAGGLSRTALDAFRAGFFAAFQADVPPEIREEGGDAE